jgi:hypothetical protein
MSKRDCASDTEGKTLSLSAEKKRKLLWPPGDSGKEFSYTFTGEEQIGHTVEVMRTVKGREVKVRIARSESCLRMSLSPSASVEGVYAATVWAGGGRGSCQRGAGAEILAPTSLMRSSASSSPRASNLCVV